DIANTFKRTPIVDPMTGQLDLRKNILNVSEDFFIPVRSDTAPNPIETLASAQNLTAIDDIKFIQNKMLSALRIPKAFLNFQETAGEGKNMDVVNAQKIHGNKYDYSKVKYINGRTKDIHDLHQQDYYKQQCPNLHVQDNKIFLYVQHKLDNHDPLLMYDNDYYSILHVQDNKLEFLTKLADVKCKNICTKKHRQSGISSVSSAWITYKIAVSDPKKPETILCIGNNLTTSQLLITKIEEFLIQVPRFFWGDDYWNENPDDPKNKKDIFKIRNKSELALFNGCRVIARSAGDNAARGISAASVIVFDEAAFIENGITVYSQAVATTASVPYAKIIMISTPNGKDQLYYNTYAQAVKKLNNYTVVDFKWYQDPRYNRYLEWHKRNEETGEDEVIKEEVIKTDGSIYYDEELWESRIQKSYVPTSPWYQKMCQTFNNDEMKIAQELDCSFLGSSNNVVPAEVIEMQLNLNVRKLPEHWNLSDPLEPDTWIWKEPIPGHRYLMSIDVSRGDAEDRTSLEIIDIDGRDENDMPILEQVLEYNGKKYGDEVGEMAYRYGRAYNDAFIVVDCIGGTGDACVLQLMALRYKNLYYDENSIRTYTAVRNNEDSNEPKEKLPGFHQSSLRWQMISNFRLMIMNNEFKIRSMRVITELETWIFKGEAKRPDHMDGCHDDNLTCLAQGLFVLQFCLLKIEKQIEKDRHILSSWIKNDNKAVVSSVGSESSVDESQKGFKSFKEPTSNNPIMVKELENIRKSMPESAYKDVDLMDTYPEIGASLDIYTDESCYNGEDGILVEVHSDSKRIKSILEDLLVNRLEINIMLPMICRNMCKYGNAYLFHNIDSEKGILGWKLLPTYEMERYEYGDMNPYANAYSTNKNGDATTRFAWIGKTQGGAAFFNWQISHFRLLYDSQFLPYGVSLLHKARRHWRILSIMEDTMLIYRLERSIERRVFKVNVGNIDPADVGAFMEDIANTFKRTPIVDPMTGQLDLRKNILNVSEDFFIPVRSDTAP
ncbi:MAG: hypothetical protein EZS28_024630, partial [Streblomastix strix]